MGRILAIFKVKKHVINISNIFILLQYARVPAIINKNKNNHLNQYCFSYIYNKIFRHYIIFKCIKDSKYVCEPHFNSFKNHIIKNRLSVLFEFFERLASSYKIYCKSLAPCLWHRAQAFDIGQDIFDFGSRYPWY